MTERKSGGTRKMKAGTQRKTLPALPRTTCSALVTRYPTGCFGIDYQGSMFFWWGFGEENVHAELERLRIPAKQVKWEERYYDRRYDFNDPRSYKTRKFIPQNA
jgi:Leu/Phe-tRNA-protein transferase